MKPDLHRQVPEVQRDALRLVVAHGARPEALVRRHGRHEGQKHTRHLHFVAPSKPAIPSEWLFSLQKGLFGLFRPYQAGSGRSMWTLGFE
jgi:hypothetical protein